MEFEEALLQNPIFDTADGEYLAALGEVGPIVSDLTNLTPKRASYRWAKSLAKKRHKGTIGNQTNGGQILRKNHA